MSCLIRIIIVPTNIRVPYSNTLCHIPSNLPLNGDSNPLLNPALPHILLHRWSFDLEGHGSQTTNRIITYRSQFKSRSETIRMQLLTPIPSYNRFEDLLTFSAITLEERATSSRCFQFTTTRWRVLIVPCSADSYRSSRRRTEVHTPIDHQALLWFKTT